jgi:Bacterial Ig-like domain (group 1)
VVQLVGVALLAVGASAALDATGAHAASITSGPVTLSTIGTVTAGTPYSSGQQIDISVAANSTLNLASLEAAGFPSGAVPIKALECSDPGALAANLPTNATECQSDTVDVISGANSDGSLTINGDTVYALPDNIIFSEGTSGPVCDQADACVIGIFSNQNDFTKPHLFSGPFYVAPNGDDGGENPGDGSPPPVTTVSATQSTVVATPTTVAADGVDTSQVTVTLEDTSAVPVAGKVVTLAQGTGHSTITTVTGTTNASGQATFKVTDATAESVTYTATDTTDSNLVITQTAKVTFAAPVVTPSNSSIAASPTAVPSGGTSMITVTLDDQAVTVAPQPIAGKVVSLSQGAGHSVITAVSATTNASGQATFTVSDTTDEVVTYTATDTTDGIALTGHSASVTFGTLLVSATASTVAASPSVVSSASSGGILPTGTVTVTLFESDGSSPVAGKTVTLSASSTTAQITPTATPDVTDAEGQATFQVADGTAEAVTFKATDVTDGIALSNGAVVTFEQPQASASTSVVTSSSATALADGVTPVTISVTVSDQFGNPLPGRAVTVTGSPSTTTRIAPQTQTSSVPAGTTGANGVADFLAYDATAETVVYTATDTTDDVTIDQTVSVTFLAGVPQSNQSTLSANPTDVPANGTTSSTVTVTLEDHNNNPVPGKTIALAAAGGNSVITAISPTTNAHGQATFGVTDTTSEIVLYTAIDTTDNLPLAGQGVAVTFGTPPPPVPALADSTIVAEPSQVPADGSTDATITVVLSDADGNALSGKTVALNPASGTSTVTTVTGVTDADGEATFTVTDTTVEAVTYTATDVTDNLPITGQSVTVTFTAPTGSGSGTTSTTTTLPIVSTTSPQATTSDASTGSSGSSLSDTGSTDTTSVSSGALAFTGEPILWWWMVGLGVLLLLFGALGRRALRPKRIR